MMILTEFLLNHVRVCTHLFLYMVKYMVWYNPSEHNSNTKIEITQNRFFRLLQ